MRIIPSIIAAAVAATAFTSYPAMADTFDGPYVGANAGWSRTEIGNGIDGIAIEEELTHEAASFGVYAGYNYRVADSFVIGAEGGFSLEAEDKLYGELNGQAFEIDPRYSFDVAARAGFIVGDKALIFARGGYANQRVRTSLADGTSTIRTSENLDGWSVGGGVEYAVTDHISARTEYRYTDFGSYGDEYERHQILVGLSYNF